ncbi:MAG: ABC transporter substrate-binding protein [Candidatus Velamenicoccus archaeovorus]
METAYGSSAIVHREGTIEELEGAAARRSLLADPDLVRYATALLGIDVPDVRFVWHGPTGWTAVRVERGRDAEDDRCVVSLWWRGLPYGLTAREIDVLTLVAGGLGNREIAARLGASARTVSTHVEHILLKLGARSRAGAAAIAVDRGLLRLPIPGGPCDLGGLGVGTLEAAVAEERGASRIRIGAPVAIDRRRPYLIGSAFPLSGPARSDGIQMRNGAMLAIDEINARGGVAGRRIELVAVDTDIFSEGGVREAFERLGAAEVDAVIVGYVHAGADLALDAAAEFGAPFLHATTSEAALGRVRSDPARYRRIFQVCPSEVHYGVGFIRFLDDLVRADRWRPRSRRLMIVETPVDSGQMSTVPTLTAAFDSGWVVDAVECVPELDADWAGLVRRIQAVDPAAVLIADFVPSELAAFQRAFAAEPTDALLYAVYAPSVPEFLELAGPAAEGLVWSTVTGTYPDLLGGRFAGRYLRSFGRPPGRAHAGITYDEVHLLAGAWASVGNPRDFDGVASHLRHGAYRGVNGTYFFDESQGALSYPEMTLDPSLGQAHLVFQVQDGEHRVLAPVPYVQASFRPPSWVRAVSA